MGAAPDEFVIERAVRSQALLRLAIAAVSGAGKTKGALRLARGIVDWMIEAGMLTGTVEGKVGVIDTERNSASLYANIYPFDRLKLEAPYTVKRYLAAARAMAAAGKTVLIIDQISHQWAGQGGMLEFVDLLRKRGNKGGGNSNEFAAWADATPEQNEFLEGLLALPCHLICTMRAKTAYVMEEKSRRDGSKYHAPRRVGLKPIQREGIEFDFTTVMDLELESKTATVSKDRTELFVDPETLQSKRFILTEEVGKDLARWLYAGEADKAPTIAPPLERAIAVKESGIRQMQGCVTVPDLARVWTQLQEDLRGFTTVVDVEVLKGLRAEGERAKDAQKIALGGDRASRKIDTSVGEEEPGPTDLAAGVMEEKVTEEQEEQLRRAIRMAGITLADCITQFKIVRLGEIRRSDFAKALGWIGSRGAPKAAPAAKPPAGKFDDMEDDIPW